MSIVDGIEDENLARIIKLQMIHEKVLSYEEISQIAVFNRTLSGIPLNIDLTELSKLKGLEGISLKGFTIDQKVVDTLNRIKGLEYIDFTRCLFADTTPLKGNIRSASVKDCRSQLETARNFGSEIFGNYDALESIEVVHSGLIDMRYLNEYKNLRDVRIASCNVTNLAEIKNMTNLRRLALNSVPIKGKIDISKLPYLTDINLDGAEFLDNKAEFISYLKQSSNFIRVSAEDQDYPII